MSRRRRRTLKSLRERIEHVSRKNINGDTDFLVIFLFHSSCGREKHGLAKVQNIAENSFVHNFLLVQTQHMFSLNTEKTYFNRKINR
jgi:hypothetical protein